MSEPMAARYWCHMCSQMVSPSMEEEIKCPYCHSGFIEEMDSNGDTDAAYLGSDRAPPSPWPPILLEMSSSSHRRRLRRLAEHEEGPVQDRDLEAALRRRRRRSSAIVQLLHALRERNRLESVLGGLEGEREQTVLINPFNRSTILHGPFDGSTDPGRDSSDPGSGIALGDYFLGPGLDLLLQQLAENDQNRHGTPPAKKEAVDAMPTVRIGESTSCPVCLEDFVVDEEVRKMPCEHKFHGACILPWLEMHSSCPVCRFQMPTEESKSGSGAEEASGDGSSGDGGGASGRRLRTPVRWPFSGLFSSSSGDQGGDGARPSSSSSRSDSQYDHYN